jgi:hypothetical protein
MPMTVFAMGASTLPAKLRPGLLVGVRLAGSVEVEAVLVVGLFTGGGQVDGFGLPVDRLVETAGFGIGGGQGAEAPCVSPVCPFTRFRGQFDSYCAVAVLGVGTGRQQPGFIAVGRRIIRIETDGFLVVVDR